MTEIGSELILRTMVVMAGVDKRIDTREINLIQQIYADLTGKTLAAPDIAEAARAYVTTGGDLRSELAAAADSIDRETKEEIIRAAYLVLLADDRISGEERKKLQDIAAALKVPEIHFGAILEDLAVWLASLKR
jgi:tellurite resistance protein